MARRYPRPGTMADRILEHVRENPGVSINGIITALETNPSPTRTCIKALIRYEMMMDEPTPNGYHSYTALSKGRRA